MTNKTKKSNIISRQAMIAAIYTVLSVCLSAISYGPVQIRISEALAMLPLFSAYNIWGVTIGCFLTNLIGFFTGANILGWLDVVFGTAATFAAAVCTYLLRKLTIKGYALPAVLPPVIFNAAVVGWELCIFINNGSFSSVIFWVQAVSVAAGQLISCGIIGMLLTGIISKNKALKEYLS